MNSGAPPPNNQRLAIIEGWRTPFCKAGGRMKMHQADDLAIPIVRAVIDRCGLAPEDIDEVIMGCVCQPAHAANIARVIALRSGLAQTMPATTVHRNCASGMESITTAWERMQAGVIKTAIVGGCESMSNVPLNFGANMTELFGQLVRTKSITQKAKAMMRFRPHFLKPVVALEQGLTDPVCGLSMGQTAENIANRFHITREQQDAYALRSHQRAEKAQKNQQLADEILPWIDGVGCLHDDDGPRYGQTMSALAKLKPYFNRVSGSVTVGNACPITDGAAAMLVMPEEEATQRGLKALGYLSAYSYVGCDPEHMGLGPIYALAKLYKDHGIRHQDVDLVELNEAFAAQVLGCDQAAADADFCRQQCGLDEPLGAFNHDRLNPHGGAIAYGHPVGTTGARLVLTILKTLRQRGQKCGIATLCVGGGQGAALYLEAAS